MSPLFTRCAVSISIAAVLAACSATGTPLQTSSLSLPPATQAPPLSRVLQGRLRPSGYPYLGGSWISPAAERIPALLYVSDFDRQVVNIYDYRSASGKLVGQLAQHPSSPEGLCVDGSGNVYVTSYQKGSKPSPEIKEYAHGGLRPLETLSLHGVQPSSCTIDSTTGTVAVALYDYANSTGGLDLIIGGLDRGHQVLLSDPNGLHGMLWDAYDPSGNLLIMGITGSTPGLDELPAGRRQFVHLSGLALNDADQGVLWDGSHIAVGDTNNSGNEIIVSEITVHGSTVRVVRRVTYTDPSCSFGAFTVEMAILRDTLVGASFYCATTIDFWSYDRGGTPKGIWAHKHIQALSGQVISTR